MSKLINKDPMSLREITQESTDFIFKNILWITLFGCIISLPVLFIRLWMHFEGPDTIFEIFKYKFILKSIDLALAPFFAGTVAILLGEQLLGHNVSWYQALQKSIKKWIPLILLQLLVWIAIMLGSFLLIIPGVIAMCATTCAIPAMMLENLGPVKAFDRSWNLTKNHRFRIFACFCLYVLAMIFAFAIPYGIMTGISIDPFSQFVLLAIILTPFQALWAAVATLLFFDLRIRKESMELENETNMISAETEHVVSS